VQFQFSSSKCEGFASINRQPNRVPRPAYVRGLYHLKAARCPRNSSLSSVLTPHDGSCQRHHGPVASRSRAEAGRGYRAARDNVTHGLACSRPFTYGLHPIHLPPAATACITIASFPYTPPSHGLTGACGAHLLKQPPLLCQPQPPTVQVRWQVQVWRRRPSHGKTCAARRQAGRWPPSINFDRV
jgi:hypothetical protein